MMLLRVVAVVELDTDVMSAAEIQREVMRSMDNIRHQKGVENNNIVFRTTSYDPYTGKRKKAKKK
jgi:hypothetical protein